MDTPGVCTGPHKLPPVAGAGVAKPGVVPHVTVLFVAGAGGEPKAGNDGNAGAGAAGAGAAPKKPPNGAAGGAGAGIGAMNEGANGAGADAGTPNQLLLAPEAGGSAGAALEKGRVRMVR